MTEAPSAAGAQGWARAHAFWLAVGGICIVTAAFLVHQLLAWPPHEDETLALFVGRDSLGGVVRHVTRERGGAPLHFVFAFGVAHLGLGLAGMRLVSVAFALASLPLVALLGVKLADRRAAVIATALVAGSWLFLFNGIYARMYSLFLFLSLLSLLLLLRALEARGKGAWVAWGAATLLAVSAHPYGALLFAAEAVFVVAARRDRLRAALVAFGAVALVGTPFWITDLVLADRFDVGVGGGGTRLGGPWAVVTYLWQTAGDFSSGFWPVLAIVLCLAAAGVLSVARQTRILLLCAVGVPVAAFMAARLGGSTSPETRHLIFVLPLFSIVVAAGLVRVTRVNLATTVALAAVLLAFEVAWAWHRTPPLFEGEATQRKTARLDASRYLAATSRPDDLLFGYEPLYLGAWEENASFPATVVPRADARLAARVVARQQAPLGRGIWILDASKSNNVRPSLQIENRNPGPSGLFETRAFGPFLVIRTVRPTVSEGRYLDAAARAMRLGQALGIGDADVNLTTIEQAQRRLADGG